MKVFHCECGQMLFFENTTCVHCGRRVAYLPDLALMGPLEPAEENLWRPVHPAAGGHTYRLCRNYSEEEVCNWVIDAADTHPLCVSCRLTLVIPNLSQPDLRHAWYRLEVAKRRVIFTLMQLSLPLLNRQDDPQRGLAFEFKTNAVDGTDVILTGHADGVVTINAAESDDVERERQRKAVNEQYRTLIGHVRHEVGHYYWDQLIANTNEIDAFRSMFGDERQDYEAALRSHYQQGPPPAWQDQFISAYASAHPAEDWAETWAHYLHMIDALETAAACGMALLPKRPDEPSMATVPSTVSSGRLPFSTLFACLCVLANFQTDRETRPALHGSRRSRNERWRVRGICWKRNCKIGGRKHQREESMSKQQSGTAETGKEIIGGFAQKAASHLEDGVERGAAAVSDMADRAANQVDWTADYLRKAGKWTAERAKATSRGIQRTVRENPVPVILAASAIAFGIGFFMKGKRI